MFFSIALCVLLTTEAAAQPKIVSWVISSGATNASGSGITILATAGQPVIGPVSNAGSIIGQGFWYTVTGQVQPSSVEGGYVSDGKAGGMLQGSYPNPFTISTEIRINVPRRGAVTLELYDALGRQIRTLLDGEREAGLATVQLAAEDLESGYYTLRLKCDRQFESMTLIVVK